MARRIAAKVHQQASRLIQAGLLTNRPAWFQAVMDHPPIPLPPRGPPERHAYDLPPPKQTSSHSSAAHHIPSKHLRTPKPRPLPVHYLEDGLRRQLFKDRPFEAFRATTLVEGGGIEAEHPVRGVAWTRLRQRGRNPSPEECVKSYPASEFLLINPRQCDSLRTESAYRA
jgi:small subunit ribosomal protein S23